MPTTLWRVVWGLNVTMDSFCPTMALMSVLLPGGRGGRAWDTLAEVPNGAVELLCMKVRVRDSS